MLRVFIRGVIEQSSSAATLTEHIEVLNALSLATASLTRMARTQKFLNPSGEGVWLPVDLIHRAIAEVNAEWSKAAQKI